MRSLMFQVFFYFYGYLCLHGEIGPFLLFGKKIHRRWKWDYARFAGAEKGSRQFQPCVTAVLDEASQDFSLIKFLERAERGVSR